MDKGNSLLYEFLTLSLLTTKIQRLSIAFSTNKHKKKRAYEETVANTKHGYFTLLIFTLISGFVHFHNLRNPGFSRAFFALFPGVFQGYLKYTKQFPREVEMFLSV